jgi:hypothetical protein
VKSAVLRFIASWMILVSVAGFAADQSAEVLRARSPDGKFALQIRCEPEYAKAEEIPGSAVESVSLVSLPDKTEAAPLDDDAQGCYNDLTVLWSADSQWCAFYSKTNRVGYTTVYRRKDGAFTKAAGSEQLFVPNKVDKKNEHILPIQWLKPGVLLLEHHIDARDEGPGLHTRFTATYDPKSNKFRVEEIKKTRR